MRLKRSVPSFFVSKSPLDVKKTHVKVPAMKQIIGSFCDARLKNCEIGKRLLIFVIHTANIEENIIQPAVFLIGVVYIVESVADECRYAFVVRKIKKSGDVAFGQRLTLIFDKRFSYYGVEIKYIVILNGLSVLFCSICKATCSAKCIKNRIKFKI